MSEVITGGIGFLAGLFVGGKVAVVSIPQYLQTIANDFILRCDFSPDIPGRIEDLALKPIYYHELDYSWDGGVTYHKVRYACCVALSSKGVVEGYLELIHWTGHNMINGDVARLGFYKLEVIYREAPLFTFPKEPVAWNTVLTGFACVPLDENGNIRPTTA